MTLRSESMAHSLLLGVMGVILLAGCAGGTARNQVSNSASAEAQPALLAEQLSEDTKPDIPAYVAEPDHVLGLTPADVQDWLGPPDLVRRDGHVQIMLYKGTDCALDVIFFETNPEDHFRAGDLLARDSDGKAMNAATCLRGLAPGRRPQNDMPAPMDEKTGTDTGRADSHAPRPEPSAERAVPHVKFPL